MNRKLNHIWLCGLVSLTLISCASPPDNPTTSQPTPTETAITTPKPAQVTLTPASDNWREKTHIHGMAIDPDNPEILYLATHHGLLQRAEDGKWLQVGTDRSDLMSFAPHPTDNQRFYASGHPPEGGNLGFIVSENKGQDWQLRSLPGVDFHALAIAPSNPDVMYAWAASGKQGEHGFLTSSDNGKTWQEVQPIGLRGAPFGLAVDPNHPDHVFATTRNGLFESIDGGKNWMVLPNTKNAPVAGLTLKSEGEQTVMYGYRLASDSPGIFRSTDRGKTWELVGEGIEGTILHLAIAPNHPEIIYAVNDQNQVFQSQDEGKTWNKLS
ncbi:F510_1955 family glycosylhydrolase [Coleofasciculus sp. G2-EDA-02]|uniref:F510_1955 family glycosylhydrolase n=1 Tax=unclassified Coleofasciculus TaxID=2692782 RepID=UPI0032F1CE5A